MSSCWYYIALDVCDLRLHPGRTPLPALYWLTDKVGGPGV
jgi:hypothetical protein